ncbi:MAG TPA: hypothetical protein VNT99_01605 [Methylomirabilota bacterium]|nr:hypothetical protein [Methylomirabilota bacterium]
MKNNNQIKPIHDGNTSTAIPAQSNPALSAPAAPPPARHVFKLGLDVDLQSVVTALQWDRITLAFVARRAGTASPYRPPLIY